MALKYPVGRVFLPALPRKDKQAKLVEVFKQFDATREDLRIQLQTLKARKQNC